MSDKDEIKDALEAFKVCQETEEENRREALADLKFARLSEQWPEEIMAQRETERRPCLTINRMPSFIRQVVNDARQNKPSIKVHPVDSQADPETADIINGLIRNIEYTSDADVAYDTGVDCATTSGFGYWRINVDYSYDDTFDLDCCIDAVPNPFAIYGDPYSSKHDSSDWNIAFVVDTLTKAQFKDKYKGADEARGWEADYSELPTPWSGEDGIMLAEFWKREETKKVIVQLSDGSVMEASQYEKHREEIFDAMGLIVTGDRETRGYKVVQKIMTGHEVLETNPWAGKYIPIVPVYGEEVNVEGKRYFRSLIRDAKDPQRMLNYWRTTSTELVALSPKAPWVGPVGAFNTDAEKWATANTKSHSHLEYDGPTPPMRQAFTGPPAGAIQEALNANDDMKAVIGIYDAGLGSRSNETSGRAIMARQRESDTSTFHFQDNVNRAIRHTGRILIDLIPKVYTGERMIRILGGDDGKKPENIKLGERKMDEKGKLQVFDFSAGKYDLTVDTGPSFTTRREEAANQMIELLRSFPAAAPIIGDLLAKNLDWPGADEIAKRLKTMLPPQLQDDDDPRVAALTQQMEQMKKQGLAVIQQLQAQLKAMQEDKSIEARKVDVDAYKAESDRIKAISSGIPQEEMQAFIVQTIMQVLNSPDILPQQQPQQPMPPNIAQ